MSETLELALKQNAVQQAAAQLERNRAALFRPDGTPKFAPAELAEQQAALLKPLHQAVSEAQQVAEQAEQQAQNLKSADWRKAFAHALKAAKSASAEEIATAHESPDSPHYAKVLEMAKADKAKEAAHQAEVDACIGKWAAQMNVAIEKIAPIIMDYAQRNIDPAMLNPAKFSSPAKYEAFKACLAFENSVFSYDYPTMLHHPLDNHLNTWYNHIKPEQPSRGDKRTTRKEQTR